CSGKCPKRPAVFVVPPAVWANTATTCTEDSWVCLTRRLRVSARKATLVSRTSAREKMSLREEILVSDHRGSNSQVIDFESVKIYPIFTIKIENPGKSNT